MKLLLTEDVEELGIVGDEIDVADGYGRNYLIPKGLAVKPDSANKKQIEKKRKKRQKQIDERREWAQDVSEELGGQLFEIERKAQEETRHLYGSVRKEDIVNMVKQNKDIELRNDQIGLDRPIEELGEYGVEVRLYEDISATIKVHVIRSGEEPGENDSSEE